MQIFASFVDLATFLFFFFLRGCTGLFDERYASRFPIIYKKDTLVGKNSDTLFDTHSILKYQKAIVCLINTDMRKIAVYNIKQIKEFKIRTVDEKVLRLYM